MDMHTAEPDPADAGQWGGSGRSKQHEQPNDGLPLVWFDDVQPNVDVTDFVEGVLTSGTMSVVYGESNSGKTFFMTDIALHIALGRHWWGRDVDQGGVIYCALEGSYGIGNRVAAFKQHYRLEGSSVPFAVVPSSINMLHPDADTGRLIETIKQAAAKIRLPVSLVVIDTLSRALAGGNENGSDDMGALVINTDRVRQETGAHVCYVHHCGKDQARGARGHSLLRAATDTEIEVTRADKASPSVATVTKQRDLEVEGEFPFKLQSVELGVNRRGKSVTSCVVLQSDGPLQAIDERKNLSRKTQIAADMLRRALGEHGRPLPIGSGYPPDTYAVTEEQWRHACYAGVPGDKQDTKRRAFTRALEDLLAAKVIASLNNFVWFVRRADE